MKQVSTAIIIDDRKRCLLGLRSDDDRSFPNTWSFPGGKYEDIDNGNFLKTALRELKEETDIDLSDIDYPDEYFFCNLGEYRGKTYLCHCYILRLNHCPSCNPRDGFDKLKWFTKDELRSTETSLQSVASNLLTKIW
jgi:8-oxo-dGTP pyrophosphatase MutT (NUDIX family)